MDGFFFVKAKEAAPLKNKHEMSATVDMSEKLSITLELL
jgi:hypothetical protein